jgi:hypothetical protein
MKLAQQVPLDKAGRPVIPAGKHCNARARQTDGYCGRAAGAGTDHVGTGRCKHHGGCTPNQQKHLIVMTESMPAPVPTALREVTELRRNDPDLHSIDNEIALLRAVQERIQITLTEASEDDPGGNIKTNDSNIETLLQTADKINKLVATSHRIQMERRMLVPAHRVVAWVDAIGRALQQHIKDPEIIEGIFRALDDAENAT